MSELVSWNPEGKGPVFIVVERNPVVSSDLVEILSDYDADAVIHVASTPQEAIACLAGLGELCLVLVSMKTEKVAATGLQEAAIAHGGRIVVLDGDETRAEREAGTARGWFFVSKPFSTQAIHGVIDAARASLNPS